MNKSVEVVTTETFYIELDNGENVVYIQYLNPKNKITDEVLRDNEGNDIDDPILWEKVINLTENCGTLGAAD